MVCTRPNSKYQQDCCLWRLQGKTVTFFFQLLEATWIPWFMAFSSSFKANSVAPSNLSLQPSCLPVLKTLCLYWPTWTLQSNPVSRSWTKSCLPSPFATREHTGFRDEDTGIAQVIILSSTAPFLTNHAYPSPHFHLILVLIPRLRQNDLSQLALNPLVQPIGLDVWLHARMKRMFAEPTIHSRAGWLCQVLPVPSFWYIPHLQTGASAGA